MLAYRSPEGSRHDEVRSDLEWVRHVLIGAATPQERRVLAGHPPSGIAFRCEVCGLDLMGGEVANAAHWSGATRILCDECADTGDPADEGTD